MNEHAYLTGRATGLAEAIDIIDARGQQYKLAGDDDLANMLRRVSQRIQGRLDQVEDDKREASCLTTAGEVN